MRLEYKFLVRNASLSSLRSELAPFFKVDQFAQNREPQQYTVRSIYFDTNNLDCYFQKSDGIRDRRKLRIRGYNEADDRSIVFLEIKKKCDNTISKFRSPVPYEKVDELMRTQIAEHHVLSTNGEKQAFESARRFLYHCARKSLRPTALVTYDREAFFCKFNPYLRITFDKNLRHRISPNTRQLFCETDMEPSLANCFIMEVKFSLGFPDWLQSIIRRYGLYRQALSKYTICLDRHHSVKPLTATKNRILC